MNQIIPCECGETSMSFYKICNKCGKYRGPSLNVIIERLDDLKHDLELLNSHLETERNMRK